jgi:hypothetical protein
MSTKSSKEIRSEIAAHHESEATQRRLDRQFHGVISTKELREESEKLAELECELRKAEHREAETSRDRAA